MGTVLFILKLFSPKEDGMKEEKKDEKKTIVVLEDGIETDDMVGPETACCYSAFMPLI